MLVAVSVHFGRQNMKRRRAIVYPELGTAQAKEQRKSSLSTSVHNHIYDIHAQCRLRSAVMDVHIHVVQPTFPRTIVPTRFGVFSAATCPHCNKASCLPREVTHGGLQPLNHAIWTISSMKITSTIFTDQISCSAVPSRPRRERLQFALSRSTRCHPPLWLAHSKEKAREQEEEIKKRKIQIGVVSTHTTTDSKTHFLDFLAQIQS